MPSQSVTLRPAQPEVVTPDEDTSFIARTGWPEKLGLLLILAAFFALGVNGIRHHAMMGQDFSFHYRSTLQLRENPSHWFFLDNTSRPLIYWLGVAGLNLRGMQHGMEAAALACIVLAGAGIVVLHLSLCRIIRTAPMRLAATCCISLLPVTVITSEVYAGDTLALLPFALICWSVVKCVEAPSRGGMLRAAVCLMAALVFGQFAKFTFLFVPLHLMIVLALAWRWGRVGRNRFLICLVFSTIVPLSVGGWLVAKSRAELAGVSPRHSYDWHGTGEMTWPSLLGLKRSDVRIFRAPTYWSKMMVEGREVMPLLEPNGFSYPALLHLGIFTDVLAVTFRNDLGDTARRPAPQRYFARWAVAAGIPVSLITFFAMVGFVGGAARALFTGAFRFSLGTWIWGALALAWFLPVVLLFPFVHHVYDWGYWLPRLVLPAIWGMLVVAYAFTENCLRRLGWSGVGGWIIFGLTLAQSSLHFCSLYR